MTNARLVTESGGIVPLVALLDGATSTDEDEAGAAASAAAVLWALVSKDPPSCDAVREAGGLSGAPRAMLRRWQSGIVVGTWHRARSGQDAAPRVRW